MRNLRILLVAIVTFMSGVVAHAKITKPAVVQVKRKTVMSGKASWYSEKDPGINRRTANNEIFDDSDLTCAIWGAPFNQRVRVTNRDNGKSIVVRVNDRGPHYRFVRRGRIIDLTRSAFSQIAPLKRGLINVEIEFIDS
ncbi:MAG: septal ring lytic transglycosylase RlpA family protein [Candidatus Omnitrophota bacterium]|nr:septal ring lytic transglycosylase RlpA family protein [Candidatus Omnitrophota bacterium]MDZ4241525.1 septal ring lytic transglycosylase RlpA family protein [Candidatus Omnitrophota bacterium]